MILIFTLPDFLRQAGQLLESAWVVVIGTLAGVVVTAVVGMPTAALVGRQQRAVAERQFQRDTAPKIREERRVIFVEYLSAYDAGMGKAHQVRLREGTFGLWLMSVVVAVVTCQSLAAGLG